MVERMSDERLAEIKRGVELRQYGNPYWAKDAYADCFVEIDALRADLAAANADKAEAERLADAAFPVVPDKETKVTLAVLDVVASGQKSLSAGGAKSTADLIKRLATERDQYRQAMETYSGAMTKATAAQVASERRLATALEELRLCSAAMKRWGEQLDEALRQRGWSDEQIRALASLQPETKP